MAIIHVVDVDREAFAPILADTRLKWRILVLLLAGLALG
jgi:hypothetical protein